MTDEIKEFIEDARAVSVGAAAKLLDLAFKAAGDEHPQPCPVSGGKDRFSFNTRKNAWHCRHCDVGGKDAIGLAAHCLELDLKSRAGFLEACSAVLGRDIPQGGERESEEERAAREARIAERQRQAAQDEEKRARAGNAFRDKERAKARGIYEAGRTIGADPVHYYLSMRACGVPGDKWIRYAPSLPYWHGQDDHGAPVAIHEGPAMVAPFIRFDASLHVELIGCHITWIDLDAPPKYRPLLYGLTKEGRLGGRHDWRAGSSLPTQIDIAAGLYEILPSKKMRGTKKGGVIGLSGRPSALRWLGAEGIENTLAFAGWEGFRDDTFYFAAGDLGNMAGPADPKSAFSHPELTREDRNGRVRPVRVQGPVPRPGREGNDADADAMMIPDHVDELVLVADGDSERVATASAMARARARHARPGRLIPVLWPPEDAAVMAAMLNLRDGADQE
ncbi:P4 alpha zinc-binding domain-containing protein [Chelativorans sp. ZYF759]|uniref:DUF7146 domain-containing protein n=1 Tax=Chelativorans sp. ZYF759 TaxID=2692213 RepID=UPI00145FB5DA|nr:primase-helicase zinc-binding domain-containing protein [Chelativorans sp. ZYF759]NMG39825.1 P4 alpha zinc-binding domain-containing protein [Chelativorans sp. ZYF759]